MTQAPGRLRTIVLLLAFGLLLLVGLTGPNAAAPDLAGAPALPLRLTPAVTLAALWTAYAAAAVAVAIALWRPASARTAPASAIAALAAAALLIRPFGSADHLNYAAYGRILLLGGDPYTASPIAFGDGADPITRLVEPPWQATPSVYGPLATMLQAAAVAVGGTRIHLVMVAWQVLIVAAWLGVRWLLRDLAPGSAARIDALWTLNPFVVGIGVFGAHLDVIGAALMLLAYWAARRWTTVAGAAGVGVLIALAGATKFPYAVVGAAALVLLWRHPRRLLALLLSTAVVTVGLHWWAGPHVFDQVLAARSSISLATLWRPPFEALRASVGGGARTAVTIGASILASAIAILWWRRRGAVRPELAVVVGLCAGYVYAASYALPWYDLLLWVWLPLLGGTAFDGFALARLAIMAWAYVPGRVSGMTDGVREVSMAFRQSVAPWLNLLVVAGLVAWLWRSGTPRADRPGSARST